MMHVSAEDTLNILKNGYPVSDGRMISVSQDVEGAVSGTFIYTPGAGAILLSELAKEKSEPSADEKGPSYEVTSETTQSAALRMISSGSEDLVLLNFASGKNPGGGFLKGSRAQEEDLCRSSGLYPCLAPQKAYYEANRSHRSAAYTDHIIYSPKVPWFRTEKEMIQEPFLASVITAPAPNASACSDRLEVGAALLRRAGIVLAIAKKRGHRDLLLGAWGCGVFGNDPVKVAAAFGDWLDEPPFRSYFNRVCFAVYGSDRNMRAFAERFPSEGKI